MGGMRGSLAIHGVTGGGGMEIGGTITGATQGSVLFAGAAGVLAQDNANFFYDDTNNRLGVGTAEPAFPLEVSTTATTGHIALRNHANPAQRKGLIIYNDGAGQVRFGRSDTITQSYVGFNGEEFLPALVLAGASADRISVYSPDTKDLFIYTGEGGGSKNVIFGLRRTDLAALNNNFEFWGGANKGNVAIGTSSFATTGKHALFFGEGTEPATMGSNTAAVYAKDVSGTFQMFGINEAGQTTQITGRTSAYTPTNVTTDRAYDANSTSIDELADVLGTLIADLQGRGILG